MTTPSPIQQAREARGLSREELAALAETTRQNIHLLETGQAKSPSLWIAYRLSIVLELTIEELFPDIVRGCVTVEIRQGFLTRPPDS